VTWGNALALVIGMVIGAGLLSLGYWLGMTWSRSASQDVLSAAQTQVQAAKAVSDMTLTLADVAARDSMLATRMDALHDRIGSQERATEQLERQSRAQTDNLAMLVDAFIQRGYLREARTPTQVGEKRQPPGPMPLDRVPSARVDNSQSHTEPTATG